MVHEMYATEQASSKQHV